MVTIVEKKTHFNGITSYEKDSCGDEFWYNDKGLLTRRKNADGFEQHWEYNVSDQVLGTWDSLGREYVYEYKDDGTCICECTKSIHPDSVANPRWVFNDAKNRWEFVKPEVVESKPETKTFWQKTKDKVFGKK